MAKRSLKTRFIIYIGSLVIFIVFSFSFFCIYRTNLLIKEELTNFGFHLATDLSYGSELAVAAEDPVLLQPFLVGIFEQKDVVLVTVYNKRGEIIVSKKKIEIEERLTEEIIETLLREKKMIKKSCYTSKGEAIYCFYSPVLRKEWLATISVKTEETIGFVKVGLSLDKIANQNRAIFLISLEMAVLLIFLGFSLSVFFAERTIKPIKELTKGAEILGKGNLRYRIKIKASKEIEDLAGNFNQMAEDLEQSHTVLKEAKVILQIKVEARTRELKELAESLEYQVKARTVELQKKVVDLEKLHKLTVGRELKMIELKEENKRLKEELEKTKNQK